MVEKQLVAGLGYGHFYPLHSDCAEETPSRYIDRASKYNFRRKVQCNATSQSDPPLIS